MKKTIINAIDYKMSDSFGTRIKKWRKQKGYKVNQVAKHVFEERCGFGLESFESEEVQTTDLSDIDASVKAGEAKRFNSFLRTYSLWEKMDIEYLSRFSLGNIIILKNMMQCDYEYLFSESLYPHVLTEKYLKETALSVGALETIFTILDNVNDVHYSDDVRKLYLLILKVLDMIIADKTLLAYLCFYITNQDESFLQKSVLSYPTLSKENEEKTHILSHDEMDHVYLMTLGMLLASLPQIKSQELDLPNANCTVDYNGSLSAKIKLWRKDHGCTQKELCYRLNDLGDLDSTLRRLQRWESMRDIRIVDTYVCLSDLVSLRKALGCDYAFLLCESDDYHNSMESDIEKYMPHLYSNYTDYYTLIELLLENPPLLMLIAYYVLVDAPLFTDAFVSGSLRPLAFDGLNIKIPQRYAEVFSTSSTQRNTLLPIIMKEMQQLRAKYIKDHQ